MPLVHWPRGATDPDPDCPAPIISPIARQHVGRLQVWRWAMQLGAHRGRGWQSSTHKQCLEVSKSRTCGAHAGVTTSMRSAPPPLDIPFLRNLRNLQAKRITQDTRACATTKGKQMCRRAEPQHRTHSKVVRVEAAVLVAQALQVVRAPALSVRQGRVGGGHQLEQGIGSGRRQPRARLVRVEAQRQGPARQGFCRVGRGDQVGWLAAGAVGPQGAS